MWVWWLMPLIPAEAGGFLGTRSQPGLCIEFQDSQHYKDPTSKEKESCWQFQCGLESFVCMSVCCAHVLAGTWASRALGKCFSTQAQPQRGPEELEEDLELLSHCLFFVERTSSAQP